MAQRKPDIKWGDKADDLIRIITKAVRGTPTSKKIAQAETVTKKATRQMTKQGKKARATATRTASKNAVKNARTRKVDEAQAAINARKGGIIRKEDRYMSKMDIEGKRGTGAYKSTTGKQKYVSAERAADARRRAGAMSSQAAKRYASMKKREDALNAMLKEARAAKDASKARKIRMELRKLRGEI